MTSPNSKEFDELENKIEERGILPEEIIETYRDFLLRLFEEDKFKLIPLKEYNYILKTIKETRNPLLSKTEKWNEFRTELWLLADRNRDANSNLYNLARCAILVYGKFDEWCSAQDSPIFYCLLFLSKIIPGIEPEFVQYFKRNLLNT